MKIFKIILIILFVIILIAVIGAVIFLKTFDIEKYKPRIIAEASSVLNREVGINNMELSLSLSEGSVLNINGLSIKEDPAFADNNFFEVQNMYFNIDLAAFIKSRQITVLGVKIDRPRLTLIRNARGKLNIESLQPSAQTSQSSEGASGQPALPGKGKEALSLPALLVNSFEISDAAITFIDQTAVPELLIDNEHIDMMVNNFSLTNPFKVEIKAALLSEKQNIDFKSTMKLFLPGQALTASNIQVKTDLATISLAKLKEFVPDLEQAGIEGNLSGLIEFNVPQIEITQGIGKLNAQGNLSGGKIKLKTLAVPVSDIKASLKMDKAKAEFSDVSLNVGSGTVKMTGTVTDYLQSQNIEYSLEIKDIDFKEIIDQSRQPVKLYGKLEGEVNGQAHGFTPEIVQTISATGYLKVNDGQLKDINVLNFIFKKISMIPKLSERLRDNLPKKYKENLNKTDTDLKNIYVPLKVEDGKLLLNPIDVSAEDFSFQGVGEIDLNQNLVMDGVVVIAEDLSKLIGEEIEELKALYTENRELSIPLEPYQGPAASYRPFPDVKYLTKRIIEKKGKEELNKFFDKVLGKDEEKQDPPAEGEEISPPPQDGQAVPNEKKSPEEELIDGLLDSIFK